MQPPKSETTAAKRRRKANDNDKPPPNAITLTDLAAMSGIDEDTLLRRLASILDKRAEGQTDGEPRHEHDRPICE